jgi:hypothetical protein
MPSAQQSPGVSPRAATRSVSAGATRPSRRRRSTNSRLRALARMRSASMPVRKPRFRNYSPTSKTTSDRLRSARSTPDRTSTSRYWIPPKSCSSRLGNWRASRDSLVGREHAFELSRDGTSHQHQRIDRKKRIGPEFRDVAAANKAPGLQRLIFRLVLDAAKRLGRRQVVGRLVDAAEQDRCIFELHASAAFDRWQHELRQIGVRAVEIELKFNLQGTHHQPLVGSALRSGVNSQPQPCLSYKLFIQF